MVVEYKNQLSRFITDGIQQFIKPYTSHISGQILRVARRFALVAVAGELATQWQLTSWSPGESMLAARKCFESWMEFFGSTGNREERLILSHVRRFFESYGASRFDDIKIPNNERIHNCAGFYRVGKNENREYLVLTETFKNEICQGFNPKIVTKILIAQGWLEVGNDGKSTQKPRVPGIGTPRCYVFTERVWDDE